MGCRGGRRTALWKWRQLAAGMVALLMGIVVVPAALPSPDVSAAVAESTGVFAASGVQVTDGSTIAGGVLSPLTVRTTDPGVTRVKCVFDGVYLGIDNASPYSFVVAPALGEHTLRCTLLRYNGSSSGIRLRFSVKAAALPPTSSPGSPSPQNSASTSVAASSAAVGQESEDVVVTDAAGLQLALRNARPGMTITMRDGSYKGNEVRDTTGKEPGRFVAAASGTATAPIILRGSRAAVLDGGGAGGGYALHLTGANYWSLQGFTVSAASRGIVLDRSSHNIIEGVHVTNIGNEGVHFRAFSSDNLLTNSVVDTTGASSPIYGEGVYIGSARSNWGTYSGGAPDRSDRNRIINNSIVDTSAENIDIKEGSSAGVVQGNVLGGDKIAAKNSADSWVDVKGNGYLIDANHGVTAPRPGTTTCGDPMQDPHSVQNPFCDGIQVHVVASGWGQDNTFSNNRLEVNAPGVGIWLQNTAVSLNNVIRCNNSVTGAGAGSYATNKYSLLKCAP